VKDGKSDFDWLAELAGSERDEIDGWSELSNVERAEIERLDAEVFGLLPYTLDPVEPSPRVKEELMRRVSVPEVQSFRERRRGPVAPRWLMPLAAGLTVLAIGIAAMQVGTVRLQQAEIDSLRTEVDQLAADAATLAGFETGLAAAQKNLQLVSSLGVEVCALRPTTATAGEDGPFGLLFVAADHQHWYVKVAGLETGPDRYYRVWFETADGLVAAGNLIGQELELASPTMPDDLLAVHVSVETEPAPSRPSDEIVLYGADMVRVL
jgi:hypothetical protein